MALVIIPPGFNLANFPKCFLSWHKPYYVTYEALLVYIPNCVLCETNVNCTKQTDRHVVAYTVTDWIAIIIIEVTNMQSS